MASERHAQRVFVVRLADVELTLFVQDYMRNPDFNTSAFKRCAEEGTTAEFLQSAFPTVTFPCAMQSAVIGRASLLTFLV